MPKLLRHAASTSGESGKHTAVIAETATDDSGKHLESPLTIAVLRTRWLLAFATPGHGRGATFREVAHELR
jgi:hypothetical protein